MHQARRSSGDRGELPTETQKAAYFSARDSRQSPSLQAPPGQPRTPAGKAASSPSRSSPYISVSAGPKHPALFRPALRQAPHETYARPRDASPADTSSMTKKAPSSHGPRETTSSLHHAIADRSSGCRRRPVPEAASTTDRLRHHHSRDAPR